MTSQLRGGDLNSWQEWLIGIHSDLAFYESEYQTLKELASRLELAVWKAKINESRTGDERQELNSKKLKMDE